MCCSVLTSRSIRALTLQEHALTLQLSQHTRKNNTNILASEHISRTRRLGVFINCKIEDQEGGHEQNTSECSVNQQYTYAARRNLQRLLPLVSPEYAAVANKYRPKMQHNTCEPFILTLKKISAHFFRRKNAAQVNAIAGSRSTLHCVGPLKLQQILRRRSSRDIRSEGPDGPRRGPSGPRRL